jgi:hypothetical protein
MPTLEINATQPWLVSQAGSVAEVERRLSVVEELATVVSANSDKSRDSVLQRATRLRQSILQETFTVELL